MTQSSFPLEFSPFDIAQMDEYLDCLQKTSAATSDYSFVNLWAWAEEFALEWGRTPNLIWLRRTKPELQYWAPVGDWNAVNWQQCKVLQGIEAFLL